MIFIFHIIIFIFPYTNDVSIHTVFFNTIQLQFNNVRILSPLILLRPGYMICNDLTVKIL